MEKTTDRQKTIRARGQRKIIKVGPAGLERKAAG